LLGALIVAQIALFLFPAMLKTQDQRLVAFGFAWFLIATLPFTIFEDRLFMRYSYLGHAGLALCVGAMLRSTIRFFGSHHPVAHPRLSETAHVA